MNAKNPSTSQPAATAAATLRSFHDRLFAAYGPQGWWPAKTPLEVIVGAYLIQNTAWRAVERSIANLASGGVLSLEGLRSVPEEELRRLIRPSGFMIRKAASIKAFIALLDRRHSGSLESLAAEPTGEARRQLLALPGVGEETADAILLYALGHPAMVADEYLRRILTRHGLAFAGGKYAQIQGLAAAAFARDPDPARPALYNEFHALVVAVGKEHCRRRARCEGCPLGEHLARRKTGRALSSPPESPAPSLQS